MTSKNTIAATPIHSLVGYIPTERAKYDGTALCNNHFHTNTPDYGAWQPVYSDTVPDCTLHCNECGVLVAHKHYKDIDEIITANKVIGNYWFSPKTLKFFHCKVYKTVYGGRYFITSETPYESLSPNYTVRVCTEGKIDTVGEFDKLPTLAKAKTLARKLAAGYPLDVALQFAVKTRTSVQENDDIALQYK